MPAQGQLATYSGRDLNGTFQNLLWGSISLAGIDQQGIEKVIVRMAIEHARTKPGMDGAQVPSWVAGDNGEIEIQVWQTSTIHKQLLQAFNLINAATAVGDVSLTFEGLLYLSNTTDNSSHTCKGVSIQKVPDKTYEAEAQVVSWVLVACSITNQ